MKLFSGFPTGKLAVTPIPNLFFSELLVEIDDLAELKLTLHLFWRLAQPRGGAGEHRRRGPYVTLSELRSDVTLLRSLAGTEVNVEQALTRALEQSAERGTLLHWHAEIPDKWAEELYFVNTESGRRLFEKATNGEWSYAPERADPEPASVAPRPNIFALYEQNIGLITPMVSEEIKAAEEEYSPEWIAAAIKVAVEENKRSWSFVRARLQRWRADGPESTSKGKPWYGDKYGKFVKR